MPKLITLRLKLEPLIIWLLKSGTMKFMIIGVMFFLWDALSMKWLLSAFLLTDKVYRSYIEKFLEELSKEFLTNIPMIYIRSLNLCLERIRRTDLERLNC